jgi:hypothetical protein
MFAHLSLRDKPLRDKHGRIEWFAPAKTSGKKFCFATSCMKISFFPKCFAEHLSLRDKPGLP